MDWLTKPAQDIDTATSAAAKDHQNQLTKPPGSLGQLEQLAIQLAELQGCTTPSVERIMIRVFAADHGVVAEGVSAFPQVVTAEMIKNFAAGGAAITVLARHLGADFGVINLGSVIELPELPHVLNQRIAAGTANFCQQAAMTPTQLAQALESGAQCADLAQLQNTQLFIGGEMGIGNTTSASALAAACTERSLSQLVGRGTGVDDQGIQRKRQAIEQALSLHKEHLDDALDILARLGGFEIAGLVGAYIRCAQLGIPILVDGFITTAAALLAVRINPSVRPWMLFSHCSEEGGHQYLLEALDATPLLELGMRLGEASGAAVAAPLLQSACRLHNEMATFAQAGVSQENG